MKINIFRKQLIVILLVMVATTGFIYYKKIPAESIQLASTNDIELEKDLGIPVKTVKTVEQKLARKISYVGTIHPKKTVQVSAKAPLQITELNIQEGDYVRKGENIAILDSSAIKAKLQTIEVKIEKTELNFQYLSKEIEKYKVLYGEGAVSKSAYDKMIHEKNMVEMQLKELYATKNELYTSLQDNIIRSPINGIVRNVNYSSGDLATIGKPVAIIDDVSSFTIKVNVSESDLKKMTRETPVLLSISETGKKLESKITQIMPSLNPKTRIGQIEIRDLELKDMDNIVIGSSVLVEFVIDEVDKALVVPADSIKQLADKEVVYKITGDIVEEIPVKTGIEVGDKIQITQGLEEGDEIAFNNINKLYNGAKVYVFRGED